MTANFAAIKDEAEATTHVGRLHDIEQFSASRFLFLRFNFTTGDAAGQNLTGKATQRACRWIRAHYAGIRDFCLEANLATDKKSSHVNILRTRGKRVTAEATIPADLARRIMRTTPSQMFRARQVSNLGALLAGVNNNGNHSANAIAALFTATGQDIANVAESSAALVHTEVLADGSYYYSITIPALIVATYGGGTGLPTQRECLELLGCYGPGQVRKLAEIVAATVLCGEVSLGAAVVAGEWAPPMSGSAGTGPERRPVMVSAPGGPDQLRAAAAKLFALRLDRSAGRCGRSVSSTGSRTAGGLSSPGSTTAWWTASAATT